MPLFPLSPPPPGFPPSPLLPPCCPPCSPPNPPVSTIPPFLQVRELGHPAYVYSQAMDLIHRLAACGLVHCDFNEFNLLIDEEERLTLIDFPQMVSVSHANARELFERDVDCIVRWVVLVVRSLVAQCRRDTTRLRLQGTLAVAVILQLSEPRIEPVKSAPLSAPRSSACCVRLDGPWAGHL